VKKRKSVAALCRVWIRPPNYSISNNANRRVHREPSSISRRSRGNRECVRTPRSFRRSDLGILGIGKRVGRWPAKTKLQRDAARLRQPGSLSEGEFPGRGENRWWAAGAWKFSPPVAKQFPWKRSYGHGFRRINTARAGNNIRERSSDNSLEKCVCRIGGTKRKWLSTCRGRGQPITSASRLTLNSPQLDFCSFLIARDQE